MAGITGQRRGVINLRTVGEVGPSQPIGLSHGRWAATILHCRGLTFPRSVLPAYSCWTRSHMERRVESVRGGGVGGLDGGDEGATGVFRRGTGNPPLFMMLLDSWPPLA